MITNSDRSFPSFRFFRLVGFVTRRYSQDRPVPATALFAWQELGSSVYRDNPHGSHSLLLRRPDFDMGQGVGV